MVINYAFTIFATIFYIFSKTQLIGIKEARYSLNIFNHLSEDGRNPESALIHGL